VWVSVEDGDHGGGAGSGDELVEYPCGGVAAPLARTDSFEEQAGAGDAQNVGDDPDLVESPGGVMVSVISAPTTTSVTEAPSRRIKG
jgi:hypothetical protein